MSGEERRRKVLEKIEKSKKAISGSVLASEFGVSRQVIVQDIALLKAQDHDIVSTHFGYTLKKEQRVNREFYVEHSDEEIEDELTLVVDAGGKVESVWVEHPVYGKIKAPMSVSSRAELDCFMEDFRKGKAIPLKNMTGSAHYHLISAEDKSILDEIEAKLRVRGYLK